MRIISSSCLVIFIFTILTIFYRFLMFEVILVFIFVLTRLPKIVSDGKLSLSRHNTNYKKENIFFEHVKFLGFTRFEKEYYLCNYTCTKNNFMTNTFLLFWPGYSIYYLSFTSFVWNYDALFILCNFVNYIKLRQ